MMLRLRIARAVQRGLHRLWRTRGPLSTALLPLAALTHGVIRWRQRQFRRHPERVWRAPIPVVIVGNLYVGGTGKTPVVMALVQALRALGWHPGVISRGYGVAPAATPRTGAGELDAALFGDEPALIARQTGAPVSVHPDRPAAVRALLAAWPAVDVIVADDGLQHYALGRDIEILVEDERGTGNGRLLPAGPLREPATRRATVDVIVTHTADLDAAAPSHAPSCGAALPVRMSLQAQGVRRLADGHWQDWPTWRTQHSDTPADAIAGIGDPARFFSMLRRAGIVLEQTRALPDHARVDAQALRGLHAGCILMTAKDAVKLPPCTDTRLHAVEVTAVFTPADWVDTLDRRLRRRARATPPTAHTG